MKLKFKLILFIGLLIYSCSDKRIIKKAVNDDYIGVNWFCYSYITDTSSDFIEVINKKNDSTVIIAIVDEAIKDVEINNDTIFISHTGFNDNNSDIKFDNVIFNYNIIYKKIDSHQLYIEWLKKNGKKP